jgi:hypothetical protein
MINCVNCGTAFQSGVDNPGVCDECQQKVLKSLQDVTLAASDQAVVNVATAMAEGKQPNFTVTAATFREGGPDYFILAWETVSAGFGELTFYREGGKLKVDAEGMSARFCQEVFEKMLEQVMDQEERKPRSSLKPQPHGHYEGHDLRRADMQTIWSVGATPKDAIEALCKARWGGTLELLGEPLTGGDPLFTWGYRFISDNGTGFKAAGIDIPGGVVLTWWK